MSGDKVNGNAGTGIYSMPPKTGRSWASRMSTGYDETAAAQQQLLLERDMAPLAKQASSGSGSGSGWISMRRLSSASTTGGLPPPPLLDGSRPHSHSNGEHPRTLSPQTSSRRTSGDSTNSLPVQRNSPPSASKNPTTVLRTLSENPQDAALLRQNGSARRRLSAGSTMLMMPPVQPHRTSPQSPLLEAPYSLRQATHDLIDEDLQEEGSTYSAPPQSKSWASRCSTQLSTEGFERRTLPNALRGVSPEPGEISQYEWFRRTEQPIPRVAWDVNCDAHTLFVGDLPREAVEQDLVSLFAPHGSVLQAAVKRDPATGRGLGYGFVSMAKKDEAEQAIVGVHRKEFGGRQLRVNWAERNTCLFVGDLDPSVTSEQLMEAFRPYGELNEQECFVKEGRCYGFVKYLSRVDAETAKEQMNGRKIGQRCVRIGWGNSVPMKYCVYIDFSEKKPGEPVCSEWLEKMFSKFGEVASVFLPTNPYASPPSLRGYGFVHYDDSKDGEDAAARAVQELHNTTVDGVRLSCRVGQRKAKEKPARTAATVPVMLGGAMPGVMAGGMADGSHYISPLVSPANSQGAPFAMDMLGAGPGRGAAPAMGVGLLGTPAIAAGQAGMMLPHPANMAAMQSQFMAARMGGMGMPVGMAGQMPAPMAGAMGNMAIPQAMATGMVPNMAQTAPPLVAPGAPVPLSADLMARLQAAGMGQPRANGGSGLGGGRGGGRGGGGGRAPNAGGQMPGNQHAKHASDRNNGGYNKSNNCAGSNGNQNSGNRNLAQQQQPKKERNLDGNWR